MHQRLGLQSIETFRLTKGAASRFYNLAGRLLHALGRLVEDGVRGVVLLGVVKHLHGYGCAHCQTIVESLGTQSGQTVFEMLHWAPEGRGDGYRKSRQTARFVQNRYERSEEAQRSGKSNQKSQLEHIRSALLAPSNGLPCSQCSKPIANRNCASLTLVKLT